MNKLILNEWIKLFAQKGIVVLLVLTLLSSLASVAIIEISDHNNRISWQETYQEEIDMYNRQLTRYPTFDEDEWENEMSYKADLMKWNNQIQKYQFCLTNQIPTWDWRMSILDQYFDNLLLLDCVRSGEWTSEDMNKYFGFATDLDLLQVEAENESLMVYVLSNDYKTYNQDQLQKAEQYVIQLQEMAWLEDEEKTIALAENDAAMWERYVQYGVAPYAEDNWVSVAILHIHEHQETYINYSHLSPEDPMLEAENAEELQSLLDYCQAAVAKDLFALNNNVVSYDIQKDVYVETSTYIHYMDMSIWSSTVLVLVGIVLATIVVANEYRYDTIKQLLIYPYKRGKILAAKSRAVGLVLMILCLILFGIKLLLGFTLYPSNQDMPIFTTYFNGTVYWMPYIVFVLIKYAFILIQALVMVSMAMMLAVISKSASIPMTVTILAYLLLPAIITISYGALGSPDAFKYLLFGNLNWAQYLVSNVGVPYAPWWVSLLVVAAWWFIMRCITFAVFKRREIREQ